MIRIIVGVEGGKELEQRLHHLARSMEASVLEEAVTAGAWPLLAEVLARVPRRRGVLAAHVGAHLDVARPDHAQISVGVLGRSVAHLVEFGHQLVRGGRLGQGGRVVGHVPAHPFLRPAFDGQEERMVEEVAAKIRQAVEEAAVFGHGI